MSEEKDKTKEKASQETAFVAENQWDRWRKYGVNVLLTVIVVIAIAAMLTAMAQRFPWRLDTTIGGTQSLRPQSVKFIEDLKTPVKIVALYPKLKSDSHEQDYYQPVADLLNEYATKGKNITTELIDPDTQKDDFTKLVTDVTNKYGGEVKGYKAILDALPDATKKLDDFLSGEAAKFRALPTDQVKGQDLQQAISETYLTLVLAHHQLDSMKTAVASDLNQQIPSYKDGVDDTKSAMTTVSQLLQQFSAEVSSFPKVADLPKAMQEYGLKAAKDADDARKSADDLLASIAKLGALTELDEFKQQLKSKSIIVMTDGGYKILQFDQVWKVPETSRFATESPDVQPQLSFAGEQQVTSAIAGLETTTKPLVVFVRAGGAPLATVTEMSAGQQQGPPFASIAQRLKDDNFDVQEKDVSGQSQQGEMPMPEPTEEQMKSAIWVVVRFQNDTQPDQPSPIGSMLEDHLRSGGAAMVMLFPTSDGMEQALSPMGISAKTDEVILHEVLPAPERRTMDFADSALQSSQAVMKLNQYGDDPITTPLEGLDFLTAASVPVGMAEGAPPGVKVTPLLPVPFSPHYWASTDAQTLLSQDRPNETFNPNPNPDAGRPFGDVDNTPEHRLYAAAASEAPDGARAVVVGSYVFALNNLVDLQDEEMWTNHGLDVARLPGNGEFFVNSVLWLAHEDNMLSISPHALQVARIREMTPAALAFWRVGVLAAGLPLAAVVAGLLVYSKRRD